MSDLTEFLLARIAEDEALARAATQGTWVPYYQGWEVEGGEPFITAPYHELDIWPDDVQHITRWQPARVLAECEAKRAILAFHQSWPVLIETPPKLEQSNDPTKMVMRMTQQITWATEQEYRKRFGTDPPTTPMLRAMATPYANHPEYRQEWAP